jgi:hypothetical protein
MVMKKLWSETFLHNLKVGDFAEHIEVCLSFSNFNILILKLRKVSDFEVMFFSL